MPRAVAFGKASRYGTLDRRLVQRPWSGEFSQFAMGSGSRFGRLLLRAQAPTASRLMDRLLIPSNTDSRLDSMSEVFIKDAPPRSPPVAKQIR